MSGIYRNGWQDGYQQGYEDGYRDAGIGGHLAREHARRTDLADALETIAADLYGDARLVMEARAAKIRAGGSNDALPMEGSDD